jgi:uncharacterized protein with HEPN domain
MNERDLLRALHMRDAAREVLDFIRGETRESLDSDKKLVRALMMSIAIIGEAAAHLSEDVRQRMPDIPWPDVTGMRHRLIHGYFEVNLDRLWGTATESVPELLSNLEAILPPEPDDTPPR